MKAKKIWLPSDHFFDDRASFFKDLALEVERYSVEQIPCPASQMPQAFVQQRACEMVGSLETNDADLYLGIQTVVAMGRRLYDFPLKEDQLDAFAHLIQGRRHRVCTAFYLKYQEKFASGLVETHISLKTLSSHEQSHFYPFLKENKGLYPCKMTSFFIKQINGAPGNLAGVPGMELYNALKGLGALRAF